jgi:hypothetical protein
MQELYPLPGETYRHYKGGTYEIISMCEHTETKELLVICKSLNFGSVHARPYELFISLVPIEPIKAGYHCPPTLRKFTKI